MITNTTQSPLFFNSLNGTLPSPGNIVFDDHKDKIIKETIESKTSLNEVVALQNIFHNYFK
jgi:hypothetical protein